MYYVSIFPFYYYRDIKSWLTVKLSSKGTKFGDLGVPNQPVLKKRVMN